MRIGHVVRQFAPSIGGLEEFVDKLSQEQASSGHWVPIITCNRMFQDRNTILPSREQRAGVEVRRIPFYGSRRYPIAPGALFEIRDLDVVHVHGLDFFFDYLAVTRALHRRPLIATTHGGFFHTPALSQIKKAWFGTITRVSMRQYGAVVACSHSDFKRFQSLASRSIQLIENGVDLEKFAGASSATLVKRMVTLGRFSTNKRIDRLLAVLAALRRQDADWHLDICGVELDWSAAGLISQIKEQGLENSVQVHVSLSDSHIRQVFSAASFFVSAAEYEGFGLALVEAMSAGLIPIAHPNDAFIEVARVTPFVKLVDFVSAEAAATAIVKLWNLVETDPPMRESIATSVALYAWSVVAKKYAGLYLEVAEGMD